MTECVQSCIRRILPRIVKDERGCWLWTGAGSGKAGYGKIQWKRNGERKSLFVHRITFEWRNGPIPSDRVIDHLCNERRCCNPDHLELVTFSENARRLRAPKRKPGPKKFCKRGHPFDAANTYIRPDNNTQQCRKCRYVAMVRFHERRAAA